MKIQIFNSRKGFSLIELLLAIFLFSVIISTILFFSLYFLKNYSFSFEETQSVGQTQTALTQMIREIREARTAEDGSWAIVNAQDYSFSFYSDVTNDLRADKVRYFLDGTSLMKGVIEPTAPPVSYPSQNEFFRVLATNIDATSAAIFRYYNGNWPDDIINNPLALEGRLLGAKYVEIYIRMNINANSGSQPYELQSGTNIRSLKTNL
jgi:prepilin-type N-terminal cleavage/methylation domain-containing protein